MRKNLDYWTSRATAPLYYWMLKLYYWNISIEVDSWTLFYGKFDIKGEAGRIAIGASNEFCDVTVVFMAKAEALFKSGANCSFEKNAVIAPRNGSVVLGDNVFIGPNALIQAWRDAPITIGDSAMLAKNVCIFSSNHDISEPENSYKFESGKPVTIGRHVWIGANAVVLAGLTVGDYAIIGAGAIVNKDVPAYTMWVGNPARQIKRFDPGKGQWVVTGK